MSSDVSVITFGRIVMPAPDGHKGEYDIKVHNGTLNPFPPSEKFGDFIGVGGALSFGPVENTATTEGSDFQVTLTLNAERKTSGGEEETNADADPDPQVESAKRRVIIAARKADFEDAPLVLYASSRDADGDWTLPKKLLVAEVSQVVIEPQVIRVTAYTAAAVLDKVWYVPTLQDDWSHTRFVDPDDRIYKFNTRDLADSGVQF